MTSLLITCLLSTADAGPQRYQLDAASDTYRLANSESVDTQAWWYAFDDPQLVQAVEDSLTKNSSMRQQYALATQATWAARVTGSALLPSVSFDAGLQYGKTNFANPMNPSQPIELDPQWSGNAAFTAGWELDLFGKNTTQYIASVHDAKAAAGDRDAQLLAFALRVGNGYYDVIASRQRVAIAEAQLTNTETLLELVDARYQAGDATSVDLLQQRQQTAAAQARLAAYRQAQATFEQQLNLAMSLHPTATSPVTAEQLPTLPESPGTGEPVDLAVNRPDIVAAQRRIDAAAKRKYSAAAQLLPTLRLSASAGRNGSIWDLTDPTTFQPTGERDWVWNDQWAVGGQLSVPLFNGGRTHSALQQANFGVHTAVQNYNTVLATAVLEVETAVASETQSTLSLTAAEAQADAARLAYESALDQYRDGTASFLTLFTAQNTYQSAELGLVDSQRNLISARLNLYDAIGGPWVSELPQPRRSTP